MADSDYAASLSDLICDEDGTRLDEEDEELEMFILLNDSVLPGTEDEYIEMLVSRETSFETRSHDLSSDSSMVAGNWLRCARSNAVRWILKTGAFFGFRRETAYLAVTYLDRFLLKRTIDNGKSWAIQLLSVACASLAAKMEECRVPVLSEFRTEEHGFASTAIQRMELLVLNTLEWRMSSVSPFAYLGYFASKFECKHGSKDLLSRAIGFIFATLEDMNLVDYRPSTVAAAAILATSSQRLTKNLVESKTSVISMFGSLEIEHVFSCYSMMIQESNKEKLETPKVLVSSDLSTNCASVNSFVDGVDSASLIPTTSKRRRLQFPHIQ